MSVKRRPDGKYRARYRDANGHEHSRHFDRIRDAKAWETRQMASVTSGTWVDPTLSKMTVEEWGTTWLASKQRLKPTTLTDYESIFEVHIKPRWGDVQLSRVTYSDAIAWLAALAAQGLSPARSNRALLGLSQILQLAVDDQRLTRNVAKKIKPQRLHRGEPRFLTHDQLAALSDACGGAGERYRLLVLLLGTTGLRWGEVRALRVKRMDLLRRRLEVAENLPGNSREAEVVSPKSHLARTVPIPAFLVDQLTVFLRGRSQDDLVFTNRVGAVLNTSNFRRSIFDPAVSALGLAPFTPHNLRDTAASLAVSAGANVKAVQRMLGHGSAAMTLDVYASLFAGDLDDVAERLDRAHLAAQQERLQQPAAAKVIQFPLRQAAD